MINDLVQETHIASVFRFYQDAPWPQRLGLGALMLVLLLLVILAFFEIPRMRARLSGIPGPRGLPVIGNLHQIRPDPAEQFRKWSQRYGKVYQIMLGEMPVVVFNSMQPVKDVFIGQGGALVDRPEFHTFHGVLSTKAASIGNTPWYSTYAHMYWHPDTKANLLNRSESTKIRRKAAAKAMNRPAVTTYLPLIDELSRGLVMDLLNDGRAGKVAFDPKPLLQNSILDLTMTLNYGTRLPKDSFDELTYIEHNVSRLRGPIGSLQDYLPILRWNPINSKSSFAKEIGRRRLVYLDRFNKELEERIEAGTDKPSIQANVMKDPEAKLNDTELMSISMSMVSGGLDTMVHTLAWTIGTLARRPDIQDAAYDAICEVHGRDDWGAMGEDEVPYVTALMKECLRYFAVLRLALPRKAARDIEFDNMWIPKGTTVVLNVWGCNRDRQVYGDDVDEFRPERFLDKESSGLEHATYGLGTRMCAGSHLANRQLYVLLIRLLWAFRIEPSTDPLDNKWNTRPVEDSTEPFHLAAVPPLYKVRWVPRSERALRNVLDTPVP